MATASAATFTPVTKQDGLASWTSTAILEGPGYLYSLHAPVADVGYWEATIVDTDHHIVTTARRFTDVRDVRNQLAEIFPASLATMFFGAVSEWQTSGPQWTYAIPKPSLSGRECPYIPDGATDWEEQEIRAAWRKVHTAAADAMARIASAFNPDPDRFRMPDTHPSANEVQSVAQFVAARALLQGRIDGCEHRLAEDRRRLEEIEEARRHEISQDRPYSDGVPDPLRGISYRDRAGR